MDFFPLVDGCRRLACQVCSDLCLVVGASLDLGTGRQGHFYWVGDGSGGDGAGF